MDKLPQDLTDKIIGLIGLNEPGGCFPPTNIDREPGAVDRGVHCSCASDLAVDNPLCLDHPHDTNLLKTRHRWIMDKLPQELIDRIIGSIDRTRPNGYSALLACSRVTRSWQKQAQKDLFPHVQFKSIDELRRWNCNIPLESKVSSYVCCLHWAFRPAMMEWSDPFLENSFPDRFASFSNIKALHVSNLSLRWFDTTAIERTFSHLSHSLRSLEITHLTTDPEKFCFLISLLPNLQQIEIPAVTMLEGGGPDPNHPHSFDFDFTGHIAPYHRETEKFFRCIAGLNPRFESFEVRILDNALVDTLNLVVRSCSATLTTVSIIPISLQTEGVSAMSRLDLSPCSNLRALRVDPEMATFPEIDGLLQTISSKHFEKLTLGPNLNTIPSGPDTSDQIFHSLAERLYRLGAMKPLTMILEFYPRKEEMPNLPDVERLWPLFCEVGVIMVDYTGWREWICPYT